MRNSRSFTLTTYTYGEPPGIYCPQCCYFAPLLIALLTARSAAAHVEMLIYNVDEVELSGYLAYAKEGDAGPSVVMMPNWMGVTASALEKANSVAADGFVARLADIYAADVRPKNAEEAGDDARGLNRPQRL